MAMCNVKGDTCRYNTTEDYQVTVQFPSTGWPIGKTEILYTVEHIIYSILIFTVH